MAASVTGKSADGLCERRTASAPRACRPAGRAYPFGAADRSTSPPRAMNPPTSRPPIWAVAVLALAGTALFSAAYCQAPLYYSNQNQYFLHGLARAGEGTLNEDWLANTKDPTPAFSAFVAFTARHLHPWAFHAVHALLQGVYAASLLGLFFVLAGD